MATSPFATLVRRHIFADHVGRHRIIASMASLVLGLRNAQAASTGRSQPAAEAVNYGTRAGLGHLSHNRYVRETAPVLEQACYWWVSLSALAKDLQKVLQDKL